MPQPRSNLHETESRFAHFRKGLASGRGSCSRGLAGGVNHAADSRVDGTMHRAFVILPAVAGLASCARHGPPAPVLACRSQQQVVTIEGTAQAAVSTWCRDSDGRVILR